MNIVWLFECKIKECKFIYIIISVEPKEVKILRFTDVRIRLHCDWDLKSQYFGLVTASQKKTLTISQFLLTVETSCTKDSRNSFTLRITAKIMKLM